MIQRGMVLIYSINSGVESALVPEFSVEKLLIQNLKEFSFVP